jgi:formylglycine-generating enzyme required for sulfatase activity
MWRTRFVVALLLLLATACGDEANRPSTLADVVTLDDAAGQGDALAADVVADREVRADVERSPDVADTGEESPDADTEPTDVVPSDTTDEADASGGPDVVLQDVVGDAPSNVDDAVEPDGGSVDSGGADAELDSDTRADVSDGTGSTDAADATDATPGPTVTVTQPTEGEYFVAEPIEVRWVAGRIGTVDLALVEPGTCDPGDAGVVLPDIGSIDAAADRYTWVVPGTTPTGDYRIRVRLRLAGTLTYGCSEVIALVTPPDCDELGCAAANRVCAVSGTRPVCLGCLTGYRDAGGVCTVVDCGAAPAAPANATLADVTDTLFGGIVTYACDPGYTVTGAIDDPGVTRRCGATGVWEPPSGTCAPVNCGAAPAAPANGTRESVDRTTLGGVASYSCNTGFRQVGVEGTRHTLTCGTSGTWQGVRATCEAVVCGALAAPANGAVSTPTGVEYADVATYTCNTGYAQTDGSATRTCQATGVWSGSPVTCTVIDCGTPPAVSNGSRTFTETTYASAANYTCSAGFARTGPASLSCGLTGTWGTPPTCTDIDECASGSACTPAGNRCTNFPGTWQCSCAPGYTGSTATGRDATCTLTPVTLGNPCTSDAQCSPREWCPNTAFRFCSPRLTLSLGAEQMPFQYVPATVFSMGSPVSELGRSANEAQVSVTLTRPYFVSSTEVTEDQWRSLTGGLNPSALNCVDCPVENLDWYSAVAFTNALSESEGLDACYTLTGCANPTSGWFDGVHTGCTGATYVGATCTGYRLLTEAEWEHAARAGTTTATYLGNLTGVIGNCSTTQAALDPIAWWCRNSENRKRSVATRVPNPFGLYDMLGNVWEFTYDFFQPTRTGGVDPTGPTTGTQRTHRGGGYNYYAENVRSAQRGAMNLTGRLSWVGIRVARTLPASVTTP